MWMNMAELVYRSDIVLPTGQLLRFASELRTFGKIAEEEMFGNNPYPQSENSIEASARSLLYNSSEGSHACLTYNQVSLRCRQSMTQS